MPLSERLVSSTSCACPPPTEAGSVVLPQYCLDSVSAITHHNQLQKKMQDIFFQNPDWEERSVTATFRALPMPQTIASHHISCRGRAGKPAAFDYRPQHEVDRA